VCRASSWQQGGKYYASQVTEKPRLAEGIVRLCPPPLAMLFFFFFPLCRRCDAFFSFRMFLSTMFFLLRGGRWFFLFRFFLSAMFFSFFLDCCGSFLFFVFFLFFVAVAVLSFFFFFSFPY
jgi:hypothetical protein